MRQSRLMELLRTFSPEERLRLRLFVDSPYFSSGEQAGQLKELLNFCLTSLDDNSDDGPEKAAAFAMVFPGEAFVTGKLEKRMSALHGLLQQFLLLEDYFKPENEPDHHIVLAQEFQKRGLPTRSKAALNTAHKLLEQVAHHDSSYYARKLKLAGQETNCAILHPSKSVKVPLNQNFEALFLFYQSVKLDLAMTFNSLTQRSALHKSALTQRIMDEEPIPPELLKRNPTMYFSSRFVVLQNRTGPNMNIFNHFIRDLRKQEHLLAPDDAKNCWAMARNVLIYWWNEHKNKELIQIGLDLYLENVARGYLYYYDKILPYALESICRMALKLDQFEVAWQFIMEHRGKISGEPDDEPFFTHVLAMYYFYTGDLEKALDTLPSSIPDNSFELNSKILEIQILYELNSELFPYRMDALRMFLKRSGPRIHSPRRLNHIHLFMNSLARICRCRPGDVSRSEAIIAQIKANPSTTEYYWLIKIAAARAVRQ